jgi:hypothetical protein
MQLFSWLHERMTGRPQTRSMPARKAAPRFRPRLEVLEGRAVPAKVTASTWTVTNNLDSGAGSLRAEIAAANSGDTIVFDRSLSGQTIQLTSGELAITKSLTIQGPGAGLLAISGGNTWRVFEVSGTGTNVTLSGLTITQGNSYYSNYGWLGGGILNEYYSTLTVSGCTISNNWAETDGGGVSNWEATLKVINSTLSGNTVGNNTDGGGKGGAVYSVGGGKAFNVSLTGCTLSNNSATYAGGAIYDVNTTVTVSGCTLSANWAGWSNEFGAGGYGGAIYNEGTIRMLKISNCAFSQNYVLTWQGSRTYSFPIDGPYTDGGGNTFA